MYIPAWIVLAMFIAMGYFLYKSKEQKKADIFLPFWIRIQPNWYDLCKDYGLVKNEDEWKKIIQKAEQDKEFSILRNEIFFTVLTSSSESQLVHFRKQNIFKSDASFDARIEEIKGLCSPAVWRPSFFIRDRISGYQIGITTPESWNNSFMAGDDKDLVTITTIPSVLFDLHGSGQSKLSREELEKVLQAQGWTINYPEGEEALAGFPIELKHKYFRVEYDYI